MEDPPEFLRATELSRAGDLAAAEPLYRQVLSRGPHLASQHNLALLLDEGGRHDEARGLYEDLIVQAPNLAPLHYGLGAHYLRNGQPALATPQFRRTLELAPQHPQAPADLGRALLSEGRYAEAWPYFDAGRGHRRQQLAGGLKFPEWRGEPLTGKSLLVCRDQGYGDQIQIARFLPLLGAARITFGGPPPLERLIRQTGVDYLSVVAEQQVGVTDHDYWTLPLSIPARLGVTLETLPTAPYLAGRAAAARRGIGVCWHGEPRNPNDKPRSLPPALGARLLHLPGAVSLHPEDSGARDFQETADLIAGLELVVTTDTSVAHLAGAMGVETWLLVAHYRAYWMWFDDPARSRWYPTLRYFRQAAPGDWPGVLDAVDLALRLRGLS